MKKILPQDPVMTQLIEYCEDKIKEKKNTVEHLQLRGIGHLAVGRLDEALNDFDKVIENQPMYEKVYYLRSRTYFEMQHFDLSYQDYRRALKLSNKPEFNISEEEISKLRLTSEEDKKDIIRITDQELKEILISYLQNFKDPIARNFIFLQLAN